MPKEKPSGSTLDTLTKPRGTPGGGLDRQGVREQGHQGSVPRDLLFDTWLRECLHMPMTPDANEMGKNIPDVFSALPQSASIRSVVR
jgi:hypothetical protein